MDGVFVGAAGTSSLSCPGLHSVITLRAPGVWNDMGDMAELHHRPKEGLSQSHITSTSFRGAWQHLLEERPSTSLCPQNIPEPLL